MARVLVIDDDDALCGMLVDLIENIGHQADCALTLAEGETVSSSEVYDVILLDVRMPDGNGLDLLPLLRRSTPPPEVIIITGAGDPDGAALAISSGAWDYLEKPISPKKIILPLQRVLRYRDGLKSASNGSTDIRRGGIIGESPKLRACLDSMALAAASEANILFSGETGTGKELFSQALHKNSRRVGSNFVVIDCAAMNESLIKSTLFGYEKGAFTGADLPNEGLIKQADGGTLFLDEIGELSLSAQKVFLRVLQERHFRPIGSKTEIHSNFRLVSATNRDLEQMVREGLFRQDLLFRLRTIAIEIPPLRERLEDIQPLAIHFATRIHEKYGAPLKKLSSALFDSLRTYDWPGNIRELSSAMEVAIYNARHDNTIYAQHLPNRIRIQIVRSSLEHRPTEFAPQEPNYPVPEDNSLPPFKAYRHHALNRIERQYLKDLIRITKGNIKKACEISGVGRTRLYTLMKKHHLSRSGWSD